MSGAEFQEWQAYERMEPFGSPQDDLRMGIIASILANTNRDEKAHPDPFSPVDFIPQYWSPPSPPKTEEEEAAEEMEKRQLLMAKVEALNAAFGGIDLRGSKPQPQSS